MKGKICYKRMLWISRFFIITLLMPLTQVQADTTFGKDVRVDDIGVYNLHDYPCITVDEVGNVYVAWQDRRSRNYDIYFTKSADGGYSFGPNVRVNDVWPGNQTTPAIAVDANGDIYLVWCDTRNGRRNPDLYFAKSTDGGVSFGPNVRVDDTGSFHSSQLFPSIAVDSIGNIYVVWYDNRNGNCDIYFAASTNGGASFSSNVRVDDTGENISAQANPVIAVDASGDIYVVWHDKRNKDFDIYFAKSTDGGYSFGANAMVSHGRRDQLGPAVGVDAAGNIYVAWHDCRRKDYDIYFAKSTDGGDTFEEDIRVDDTGKSIGYQHSPAMAVRPNGTVYVAWHDERNGNYDIYATKSADGGSSFMPNVRVDDMVRSTCEQTKAAIAVSTTGSVYVVWRDCRDGNLGIYFSKGTFTP